VLIIAEYFKIIEQPVAEQQNMLFNNVEKQAISLPFFLVIKPFQGNFVPQKY